ncbi:siderophore-interacting protein [Arthrobacter sp. AZCC_0090]|uniref:siderophore-interacting protein n=1 Tax=Arthrobacter sp. AZCC_0090 TaxID=2735881 RepID=UPI0017F006A8|nr:siderophore-interacting protein [Arthrobacter sp. AZCC_0090]MBB6406744.1 NADPH-dependent ferric siderophore reductase [Arthrobacter sp. AZCC_0090]
MNANAVRNAITEPMTLAFDVTVTAVQDLGPNFRRITFGGYCLRGFGVSGNTLDLRIKLMIPSLDADGHPLPLPAFNMGHAGWYQEWLAMDPAVRGSMRTYTVRNERLDAVYPEIDVDFVMHFDDGGGSAGGGGAAGAAGSRESGRAPSYKRAPPALRSGGPAANWALAAKPGDSITIIGPNNRAAHCITAEIYSGIEWRPGLAQRVLLAGDETAVPAISAILESLPAGITGHAFLEVPEAGDFLDLATEADIEITWLARGAAIGRSRPHGEFLKEAVRGAVPVPGWVGIISLDGAAGPEPEDVNVDQDILWETPLRMDTAVIETSRNPGLPAGALPFYAWIAGEAGVIKELRRYLVRDVGIDRKQVAFMGYWRKGKAEL